jgi:predicted alpha/beta hydrolase
MYSPAFVAKPQSIRLRAADGFDLGARVFAPEGDARGGVIVNCGTGLTQRLYKHMAKFLAREGYETLTYDYRGMGESRPDAYADSLRGFAARKVDWARLDFAAAIDWHRERAPDRPLFLVGHSFGGQAIGLQPRARELDGIVLVAAQSGDLRHWHGADRRKLAWAWYATVPVVTTLRGYLPGKYGTGDDLPAGVAREWRRWCLTRGFFTGVYPEARENFAAIRAPVLSLTFTDDTFYAPASAVEELHGWLEHAEIVQRRISPSEVGEEEVGHFGFFTRVVGEQLWPDVIGFFDRVAHK